MHAAQLLLLPLLLSAAAAPEVAEPAPEPQAAVTEPAPTATEPAPAAGTGEATRLDFVLFGNFEGELARTRCRDDADGACLFYASQAGFYFEQKARAEAEGALEPIALNSGDSIFPGSLARYLLSQGEKGAARLARLLAQIPYAAHAVGNHEFAPPRREFLAFFGAAREAGLHLQAANVRCKAKEGFEEVCEAVGTAEGGEPFRIVERGPLKVAVTSVMDPEVVDLISKTRVSGIELEDPEKALATLVPRMRKAGADLVVVLFHLAGKQSSEKAERLAGRVDGIDLVVTNGLFAPFEADHDVDLSEARPNGYVVAPRTRTFLVGADTGNLRAVLASAELVREEGRWRIARLDPSTVPTDELAPHPETAKMLEEATDAYCEDWGRPIRPDAELAQAFDLQDLRTFILNVMRFQTGSEVAVANADAFRNQQQFPLTDTLTRADLYSTLPYGNKLVTFEVKGAELLELAKRLDDGELVAAGLEKSGDAVKVNGRPVDKARAYRVATNQFLAEGGDGVLDPKKLKDAALYSPEGSETEPTIAAVVIEFVDSGAYAEENGDKLSPEGNFPDLHAKFLWTYTGSVNASYVRIGVSNPQVDGGPAYDRARLAVNASDIVNFEAKAAARADSRNHGWDNDLLLLYATARVNSEEAAAFSETSDTVRLRSAYKFLGVRSAFGNRWWAPVPFAELQVESELTAPEERDWHLLEFTGIVGTLFRIAGPLELKVGFNAKRSIFEPGAVTTFGLNAGYQLKRFDLFNLLGKPVQLESELDYFYNSIGSANINELRSLSRLYFALTNRLFFTASYNTYFFRTAAVRVPGHSTEVNVGLNFLWDRTVQDF